MNAYNPAADGIFAGKAEAAQDIPARVEDALIDARNSTTVKICRVDACSSLPIDGPPVYRVWAVIPGNRQSVFVHDSRDDAEDCAISAVMQGANVATIEWIDGRTWRQEVWAEVQS